MRNASLQIEHQHWEQLRQACPCSRESGLLELHERMSRQVADAERGPMAPCDSKAQPGGCVTCCSC